MYTINAIAKQANVAFDTARDMLKRKGLAPVHTYNNGAKEVRLYAQDAMNYVVTEAGRLHAKRAAIKMKALTKLTGKAAVINNDEVLNVVTRIYQRLDNIESTLARIEQTMPRFDMEAV